METVYLSMGSNVGDRDKHCRFGLSKLAGIEGTRVTAKSRIYETEPVGFKDQGRFLNLVVKIETGLSPLALLKALKTAEAESGRDFDRMRFGPRTLDMDILLYGDLVLDRDYLTIPHPRMHERRFVLKPLCDLDPDVVHPVLKKTASRLLDELGENEQEVTLFQCDF